MIVEVKFQLGGKLKQNTNKIITIFTHIHIQTCLNVCHIQYECLIIIIIIIIILINVYHKPNQCGQHSIININLALISKNSSVIYYNNHPNPIINHGYEQK